MRTRTVTALALTLALAAPAGARTLGDARKAAWLAVAHPGLGEHVTGGGALGGQGGRARARWRAALGVAALAALIVLGRQAGGYVLGFAGWVKGLGAWGPVVFIAGYVLAPVAFVPGVLLTLAAGAIFGLVQGVLYVFVAATLGASAAFLVGRYLARAAVEPRIAANPRFAAIDRAVGAEGRKIVFLLRLSPVFPFNLLNYALGLT